MRSADLTKEASLKLWQDKWQHVFKNGKLPNLFGEREDQLTYIEKMIERIKNCEEYV